MANEEIKIDRARGVVTIPLRMIMRQMEEQNASTSRESGNRPGIERQRDGDKAELVQKIFDDNPDAPVAEIVNRAHEERPDITKPNLRYLANKLVKQHEEEKAKQPARGRRRSQSK